MIVSAQRLKVLIDAAQLDLAPTSTFHYSDVEYYLPSMADVLDLVDAFFERVSALGIEYTPEVWDCDDMARAFVVVSCFQAYQDGTRRAPFAVGQLSGYAPNHALNLAVTSDRGVIVIEPQDGSVFYDEDAARKVQLIDLILF